MRKEEIIAKRAIVADKSGDNLYINLKDALNAMDEWAKQQAIDFYRFINSKFEPHGDNFVRQYPPDDDKIYFIDELYSQFIEQQTENK